MKDNLGLGAMLEYIEKYGKLSFDEKPFNEIDNLIFSQLVYTDFDDIVDNKKSEFLCDAAIKYSLLHSDEEIEQLLGINQKSFQLLLACAKTKRYGYVRLTNYVNNVSVAIDKQFAGINFILNDHSSLIAFRGTDATVAGVKESAMLSYMFPVPAQIEALHYFQETAMLQKGDIYVCGHSKGGNLAVFAAVNCSNSLKKRIAAVYEDDAPGFPKWFFSRYDYKQIKDKIHLYTPQGSIIGRMLYHDEKPTIVVSSNFGIKQHQVSSWGIVDDRFETVDKYDSFSNFCAEYINTLIDYVGDDDLEVFFDTLEYVLTNMSVEDFYDLKNFDLKNAFGLIDSLSNLDDAQKERFKLIIKRASADFAKEFISGKARGYSKRAKQYFEQLKEELSLKEKQ